MNLTEQEKTKYEQVWSHDAYRKFSPGVFAIEQLPVRQFFNGCSTVLDVGCGSGKAAKRLIQMGYRVAGFDIATNCLDNDLVDVGFKLYQGCVWEDLDKVPKHHALFCTDLMEHIPTDKVQDSLIAMRQVCEHGVFFGIAMFSDGFGPKLLGTPLHLTVRPSNWWLSEIEKAGFVIPYFTVDYRGAGWFYCFAMKVD